jgi:hypothetical protein
MAAPMIFELPFDLLVMARTYPPIPPYPGLYRALFFLPLFLVEITALSFLPLSPMVRLSRGTFFLFGSMLVVFAAWGLAGFSYPSAALPIAMNVISKLLALGTALSLYLPPQEPAKRAARTAASPSEVNAIARLARIARTSALPAAPSSSRPTMTCAMSTAELKTVPKKEPCSGRVTNRLRPMPRASWMMSRTAAPMLVPRRAASRSADAGGAEGAGAGVPGCAWVMSCLR